MKPGTADGAGSAGRASSRSTLGLSLLLVLIVGTVDLGRPSYQYNGVAEAAREIARATSVHPGADSLGDSTETAVGARHPAGARPGARRDSRSTASTSPVPPSPATCHPGSWVRVTRQLHASTRPCRSCRRSRRSTLTSSGSAEIQ